MEAHASVTRALGPHDPALTYASVLDALPIVAYMASPEGVVTYVSPEWRRVTGRGPADVLRDGDGIVHPDDRARASAGWSLARATGTPFRAELQVQVADGSFHWVVNQAEPVRDDGAIAGWFGTITDIDDLKRTQAALAASESTYRAFSATIPGVTWAASPAGELNFVGEQWTALHGKPREGALGESWLKSVYPADVERVLDVWARSLESGDPYDVQFRLRVADGTYRWFLVRAVPVRDDAENIVRWVGVNVDIDDQRRADEAREKFVRLIEASDDFIGIGDEAGNVTYLNEAGRRMVGIESADAARAMHLMDFFAPDDRAFVENTILPCVRRDGRWTGEFRMRHMGSNEPVPIWYNVFSLLDEAGEATGIATVSRDLRERHRVDAGLRALAEAGAGMYGSLDFDGTVRNVANAVAKSFATYCVVDTVQPNGTIVSVAGDHHDSAVVALLERAAEARAGNSEHPATRAIERNDTTLIETVTADWMDRVGIAGMIRSDIDRLDLRSLMFVPIRSMQDGRAYGALTCVLDGRDPRGKYTAEDARFAQEIAVRAGLAFDHARAYEHERRIAVTLQEASLPGMLPAIAHLYLSAEYRPGSSEATIGGDWYDAFALDDGRVVITIGDVLGNGLAAAVTMGKARQAMQSVAMVLPDPNTMLAAANRTVCAQAPGTYATALAGIFDPAKYEFTFASAGHPGPAVRHPDGRIEELSSPGLLLGLRERSESNTTTISAPPGSVLVFFTDGLIEATRDADEGQRRLFAAMSEPGALDAANPAHELVERVLERKPATDDIAVLIAEIGPRAMTYTWRLPARFENVSTVRREISSVAAEAGAAPDDVALVELAAGELVANAMEHGDGESVEIAMRVRPDSAVIAVTNIGAAFERRTIELGEMGLEENGRGLAILAAFGCTVTIEPARDACTVTAQIPFHGDRYAEIGSIM